MAKSKIGIAFASLYLLACLVATIYAYTCSGMYCWFVLVAMMMPWIFLADTLFLPNLFVSNTFQGPILFPLLFLIFVSLNAMMFYGIGLLISLFVRRVRSSIDSVVQVDLRPYSEPEPRTFHDWCNDLGLESEGKVGSSGVLDYDSFCFFPNVVLRKTKNGTLYGWWRQYEDKWGECRTVKEWIEDLKWDLDELKPEDLQDLNLFLGYDEFWAWCSGKLSTHPKKSV